MDRDMFVFILGLALAIPIGIFTNILTPRFQRWQENRPRVSARKKLGALQSEFDQVRLLHDDKDRMYLKSISTGFVAFLYFTLGNVLWALPTATATFGLFSWIGEFLPTVFAITMFLSAMIQCLNHIRLISKVVNFEKYQQEIERQMERLRAKEAQALSS